MFSRLSKTAANGIGFFAGICLIAWYFYLWFTLPGILHFELVGIPNSDIPNFIHGGMSGGHDFIAKSFDLSMIEGGLYRPRLAGFMIQYLDIKSWLFMNAHLPTWGGHWPAVIFSGFVLVLGAYLILQQLFPDLKRSIVFFSSAVFLFLPHYIAATFLFLRTAKLMSAGVTLILVAIFLFCREKIYASTDWKKMLFCGFGIMFLYTVDEQVLYVGLVLCIAGVLAAWPKRRWQEWNVVMFGSSLLWYASFHMVWGKALFRHYTHIPLGAHPHQIQNAILNFHSFVHQGLSTYHHALFRLCGDEKIVFAVAVLLVMALIVHCKKGIFKTWGCLFLAASAFLPVLLVTAHPAIYKLKELPLGMYYNITILLALLGILFLLVAIGTIRLRKVTLRGQTVAVILLLLVCIFHVSHVERSHLVHGTEGGAPYGSQVEGIDAFVKSPDAQAMGVRQSYFNGLFVKPSDYYEYVQKNDIHIPWRKNGNKF